ncbi:MAG TPA: hypothetical protein VN923_20270, partial [Thermoanaerobaculia bacterium]|nr:hypothetical protein [Thermoanaerobaculia bacterium]
RDSAWRSFVKGGAAGLLLSAVLAAAFVLYPAQLLRQRATQQSPPARAAVWARTHVPREALVLYERELESHALEMRAGWRQLPADARMPPCAAWRPVFLLAEGASPAARGATFRWTESRAWHTLTRGHLGVVSWTPVAGGRLFEAREGVYGAEPSALAWLQSRGDGRAWRWLADHASMRVCPAGARALDLGLRLPEQAPYGEMNVDVAVGGEPPRRLHLVRGAIAAVRLPLPASRLVRVDLAADRAFVPADTGLMRGDRRRLAVQLVRFELVGTPR